MAPIRLFVDVTGQGSPLALVVSTLLIAARDVPIALCPAAPPHPGRHRPPLLILRSTQDKKYNAQQVGDFNRLAQFAIRSQNATARDETGMDALLAELERVIQETLQPEGVRIWLKK